MLLVKAYLIYYCNKANDKRAGIYWASFSLSTKQERRPMKNILVAVLLLGLAAVSTQGQGLVGFYSGAQRISTNSTFGGSPSGSTETASGQYYYALYCSPTATSVNGQTNAIFGFTSVNQDWYAFNDTRWTLVAYGVNTSAPGRFASIGADSSGETVVPGVAGGTSAQFVIIGWSANIGTNIEAVENWLGYGYSVVTAWIGQSVVSGPLMLGDGASHPTPAICGANAPQIQGFTLGMASVDLDPPPYIESQPTNETVAAGAAAHFSVVVASHTPVGYRWMFGTNIINQASSNSTLYSTLTIVDVEPTNAGTYSVLVFSDAGSATSNPAILTVVPGGPTILGQPANVIAGVGGSATFTINVGGTPPFDYQWSFNGAALAGGTNATLTLTAVQTNNAGNYVVAVTNSYGAAISSIAVLTIETTPPTVLAQPVSLAVQAGDDANFLVIAAGSTPLNYQWSFNGTNIPGAMYSGLTLYNVQGANAGNYVVSISNLCGTTNSVAATLTVNPGGGAGYVIFANNNNSVTKIYTNSAVGGAATGLTVANAGLYYYALYASTTATTVNGHTNSVTGAGGGGYAFSDTNWILVAYGDNISSRGRFASLSTDNEGETPVPGFVGGTTAQFVVIGWSANAGPDIASVQGWFNGGSPASDGWIGQSVVSGRIQLGDGAIIPPAVLFGAYAPQLQGFTLGLASPNAAAVYPVPYAPPAVAQASVIGKTLQLSWLTASGSWGVQSANSPSGPWRDTGLAVTISGTSFVVTLTVPSQNTFYRLVEQ
jgi:hypothetical protein